MKTAHFRTLTIFDSDITFHHSKHQTQPELRDGETACQPLRPLIAIEESGAPLGASDKAELAQPGASKSWRELGQTFQRKLFECTNRGLIPNEAGQCVLRFARLIQADINNLRFELDAIACGAGRRLAIGRKR